MTGTLSIGLPNRDSISLWAEVLTINGLKLGAAKTRDGQWRFTAYEQRPNEIYVSDAEGKEVVIANRLYSIETDAVTGRLMLRLLEAPAGPSGWQMTKIGSHILWLRRDPQGKFELKSETVFQFDSNSNLLVMNGVTYKLIEAQPNLFSLIEQNPADLNGDNRLDFEDSKIMAQALDRQIPIARQAASALRQANFLPNVMTPSAMFAVNQGGGEYWLEYELPLAASDPSGRAFYDMTVTARSYDGKTLPAGYRYQIEILDGNNSLGVFNITGRSDDYRSGTLKASLENGWHQLRIVWKNPAAGATLEIGQLTVAEAGSTSKANLITENIASPQIAVEMTAVNGPVPSSSMKINGVTVSLPVFTPSEEEMFGGEMDSIVYAEIDEATGAVIRVGTIMPDNAQSVLQFRQYVVSLPEGRMIAALSDRGALGTENLFRAFEALGSAHIREINPENAFVFVGTKGTQPGSAREVFTQGISGQSITASLSEKVRGGAGVNAAYVDANDASVFREIWNDTKEWKRITIDGKIWYAAEKSAGIYEMRSAAEVVTSAIENAKSVIVLDGVRYTVSKNANDQITFTSILDGDFTGDGQLTDADKAQLVSARGAANYSREASAGTLLKRILISDDDPERFYVKEVNDQLSLAGFQRDSSIVILDKRLPLIYDVEVPQTGNYKVGLEAGNYLISNNAWKMEVDIYVDDELYARSGFDVNVSQKGLADFVRDIQLSAGKHRISFYVTDLYETGNHAAPAPAPDLATFPAGEGAALLVKRMILMDSNYRADMDLNHDNILDGADESAYDALVSAGKTQRVSLNQDDVTIIEIAGNFYTVEENNGAVNFVTGSERIIPDENGKFAISGVTYEVLRDVSGTYAVVRQPAIISLLNAERPAQNSQAVTQPFVYVQDRYLDVTKMEDGRWRFSDEQGEFLSSGDQVIIGTTRYDILGTEANALTLSEVHAESGQAFGTVIVLDGNEYFVTQEGNEWRFRLGSNPLRSVLSVDNVITLNDKSHILNWQSATQQLEIEKAPIPSEFIPMQSIVLGAASYLIHDNGNDTITITGQQSVSGQSITRTVCVNNCSVDLFDGTYTVQKQTDGHYLFAGTISFTTMTVNEPVILFQGNLYKVKDLNMRSSVYPIALDTLQQYKCNYYILCGEFVDSNTEWWKLEDNGTFYSNAPENYLNNNQQVDPQQGAGPIFSQATEPPPMQFVTTPRSIITATENPQEFPSDRHEGSFIGPDGERYDWEVTLISPDPENPENGAGSWSVAIVHAESLQSMMAENGEAPPVTAKQPFLTKSNAPYRVSYDNGTLTLAPIGHSGSFSANGKTYNWGFVRSQINLAGQQFAEPSQEYWTMRITESSGQDSSFAVNQEGFIDKNMIFNGDFWPTLHIDGQDWVVRFNEATGTLRLDPREISGSFYGPDVKQNSDGTVSKPLYTWTYGWSRVNDDDLNPVREYNFTITNDRGEVIYSRDQASVAYDDNAYNFSYPGTRSPFVNPRFITFGSYVSSDPDTFVITQETWSSDGETSTTTNWNYGVVLDLNRNTLILDRPYPNYYGSGESVNRILIEDNWYAIYDQKNAQGKSLGPIITNQIVRTASNKWQLGIENYDEHIFANGQLQLQDNLGQYTSFIENSVRVIVLNKMKFAIDLNPGYSQIVSGQYTLRYVGSDPATSVSVTDKTIQVKSDYFSYHLKPGTSDVYQFTDGTTTQEAAIGETLTFKDTVYALSQSASGLALGIAESSVPGAPPSHEVKLEGILYVVSEDTNTIRLTGPQIYNSNSAKSEITVGDVVYQIKRNADDTFGFVKKDRYGVGNVFELGGIFYDTRWNADGTLTLTRRQASLQPSINYTSDLESSTIEIGEKVYDVVTLTGGGFKLVEQHKEFTTVTSGVIIAGRKLAYQFSDNRVILTDGKNTFTSDASGSGIWIDYRYYRIERSADTVTLIDADQPYLQTIDLDGKTWFVSLSQDGRLVVSRPETGESFTSDAQVQSIQILDQDYLITQANGKYSLKRGPQISSPSTAGALALDGQTYLIDDTSQGLDLTRLSDNAKFHAAFGSPNLQIGDLVYAIVRENGRIRLSRIGRESSRTITDEVLYVSGTLYQLVENMNGSITLTDGAHEYVADATTGLVQLGDLRAQIIRDSVSGRWTLATPVIQSVQRADVVVQINGHTYWITRVQDGSYDVYESATQIHGFSRWEEINGVSTLIVKLGELDYEITDDVESNRITLTEVTLKTNSDENFKILLDGKEYTVGRNPVNQTFYLDDGKIRYFEDAATSTIRIGPTVYDLKELNKKRLLEPEIMRRADLNGDGVFNSADGDLLKDLLGNYKDVNRDGIVDDKDVADLNKIIDLTPQIRDVSPAGQPDGRLTAEDFLGVDINKDGEINFKDANDLNLVVQNRYDLDRDGKTDEGDLVWFEDILRKIQDAQAQGIVVQPKEYAKLDINADGVVDHKDVGDLTTALNGNLDVNGNGKLGDDEARIKEMIEALALNVTQREIQKADIDHNSVIDGKDVSSLNDAIRNYNNVRIKADYDASGLFDFGDLISLQRAANEIKQHNLLSPLEMSRADINQDGHVDEQDWRQLAGAIAAYRDVNEDGVIDQQDVEIISRYLTYSARDAMPAKEYRLETDEGIKSENIGIEAINLDGVRYVVNKNPQGAYVMTTGDKTYTAYQGINMIEINSKVYDIYENQDGSIELREQKNAAHRSVHQADFVILVNGKEYDVLAQEHNLYLFRALDGTEVRSDFEDKVVLEGKTFILTKDPATRRAALFESIMASRKKADQILAVSGIEYRVINNLDRTYTFIKSGLEKRSDLDTKRVELEGTVYDIVENPSTGRIHLVQHHATSEVVADQVIRIQKANSKNLSEIFAQADMRDLFIAHSQDEEQQTPLGLDDSYLVFKNLDGSFNFKHEKTGQTFTSTRIARPEGGSAEESESDGAAANAIATVTIDNIAFNIFRDYERGGIYLEEKRERSSTQASAGASAGTIQFKKGGQIVSYDWAYDQRTGELKINGQWVDPATNTALVDGQQLIINFDPVKGRLMMDKDFLRSSRLADQRIKIEGTVYNVRVNKDGSYTFFDGTQSFLSNPASGRVTIRGREFNVTSNLFTGTVTLTELYEKESTPLYDQVIELDGKEYKVRYNQENYTLEFTSADGQVIVSSADKLWNEAAIDFTKDKKPQDWNVERGTWQLVGGQAESAKQPARSLAQTGLVNQAEGDFDLALDMTFEQISGEQTESEEMEMGAGQEPQQREWEGSVLFQYRDSNNHYAARILLEDGKVWVGLYKVINGIEIKLSEPVAFPFVFNHDDTYRLRVSVRAGKIQVGVNDKVVISAEDHYLFGEPGKIVLSNLNTAAQFDNIFFKNTVDNADKRKVVINDRTYTIRDAHFVESFDLDINRDGQFDRMDAQTLLQSLIDNGMVDHDTVVQYRGPNASEGEQSSGGYGDAGEEGFNLPGGLTVHLPGTEFSSQIDINKDGVGDQRDLELIQAMLNASRRGEIAQIRDYEKADLNHDGKVNEADWKLIEDAKAAADQSDINGDGATDFNDVASIRALDRKRLLNVRPAETERADVDHNGTIDSEDFTAMRRTLNNLSSVDLNFDGKVSLADELAAFDKAKQFYDLGLTLTAEQFGRADINQDGAVDQADLKIYETLTKQWEIDGKSYNLFDLNHDGVVDQKDQARMSDILFGDSLKLTDAEKVSGDANKDGVIDSRDLDLFQLIYQNRQVLDTDASGTVTGADMDKINQIRDWLSSQSAPETGIVQLGELEQAGVNVRNRTELETYLNEKLATARHQLPDINGDGKTDSKDLSRFFEIKEIASYGLSQGLAYDMKFDINKDGKVDDRDLADFEAAIRDYVAFDADTDGDVDAADVTLLEKMIRHQRLGYTITSTDLQQSDINGDGFFDQSDVDLFGTYLPFYRDVTGDKKVDDKDVTAVRSALEIQQAGYTAHLADGSTMFRAITLDVLRAADFTGDSVVDSGDLSALQSMQSRSLDLTGEGLVDAQDILRLSQLAPWGIASSQVGRADVNGDGVIDASDQTALLSAMQGMQRADINGDGRIDNQDLKQLSKIVEAANLKVTSEDVLRADVLKNYILDSSDVNRIIEAVQALGQYDINGDRLVNALDLDAIFFLWGTDPSALLSQQLSLMQALSDRAMQETRIEQIEGMVQTARQIEDETRRLYEMAKNIAGMLLSPSEGENLKTSTELLINQILSIGNDLESILTALKNAPAVPLAASEQILNQLTTLSSVKEQAQNTNSAEDLKILTAQAEMLLGRIEEMAGSDSRYAETLEAARARVAEITALRDEVAELETKAIEIRGIVQSGASAAILMNKEAGVSTEALLLIEFLDEQMRSLLGSLEAKRIQLQSLAAANPKNQVTADAVADVEKNIAAIREASAKIHDALRNAQVSTDGAKAAGEEAAAIVDSLKQVFASALSVAVLGALTTLLNGMSFEKRGRALNREELKQAFDAYIGGSSLIQVVSIALNLTDSAAVQALIVSYAAKTGLDDVHIVLGNRVWVTGGVADLKQMSSAVFDAYADQVDLDQDLRFFADQANRMLQRGNLLHSELIVQLSKNPSLESLKSVILQVEDSLKTAENISIDLTRLQTAVSSDLTTSLTQKNITRQAEDIAARAQSGREAMKQIAAEMKKAKSLEEMAWWNAWAIQLAEMGNKDAEQTRLLADISTLSRGAKLLEEKMNILRGMNQQADAFTQAIRVESSLLNRTQLLGILSEWLEQMGQVAREADQLVNVHLLADAFSDLAGKPQAFLSAGTAAYENLQAELLKERLVSQKGQDSVETAQDYLDRIQILNQLSKATTDAVQLRRLYESAGILKASVNLLETELAQALTLPGTDTVKMNQNLAAVRDYQSRIQAAIAEMESRAQGLSVDLNAFDGTALRLQAIAGILSSLKSMSSSATATTAELRAMQTIAESFQATADGDLLQDEIRQAVAVVYANLIRATRGSALLTDSLAVAAASRLVLAMSNKAENTDLLKGLKELASGFKQTLESRMMLLKAISDENVTTQADYFPQRDALARLLDETRLSETLISQRLEKIQSENADWNSSPFSWAANRGEAIRQMLKAGSVSLADARKIQALINSLSAWFNSERKKLDTPEVPLDLDMAKERLRLVDLYGEHLKIYELPGLVQQLEQNDKNTQAQNDREDAMSRFAASLTAGTALVAETLLRSALDAKSIHSSDFARLSQEKSNAALNADAVIEHLKGLETLLTRFDQTSAAAQDADALNQRAEVLENMRQSLAAWKAVLEAAKNQDQIVNLNRIEAVLLAARAEVKTAIDFYEDA
ncbi:MAG: hypothetical protein HYZ84_00795, partial [Candidatus Omnitrophica bacterium]|nr:hypothetical protein [Candidatus Omnitrophota bacterium]